jgi:hypothetical protein
MFFFRQISVAAVNDSAELKYRRYFSNVKRQFHCELNPRNRVGGRKRPDKPGFEMLLYPLLVAQRFYRR